MPTQLEDELLRRQVPSLGSGPVGMSNNPLSMLMRLFQSGGRDIELPNETGDIDPRIPQPMQSLRQAFDLVNKYAAGSGSELQNVQQAGRR